MDTIENKQCGVSCRLVKRLIGQILVDGEFISPKDLQTALEKQMHANDLLGEILVRMGLLDPRELDTVLSVQKDFASIKDSIKAAAGIRQLLGELLIRARRATPAQVELALSEQIETDEKLGDILVRLGLITESELDAILAFQHCQDCGYSSERFRLGEILVAANHISREQLEDALVRQKVSKKKIGEVLIEAGYAEPHHVAYALVLQNKLVTAALIAALSLSSVHNTDASQSDDGSKAAGSTMTVSATVRAYSDLKVISQPSELIVKNADIVRGYIDVPAPTRIEIRSNTPNGYLLAFEGLAEPFKEVQIRGLGGDFYINSSSGWVAQPYSRGTVALELTYRFVLSERPQPGTYAWPLTISIIPK